MQVFKSKLSMQQLLDARMAHTRDHRTSLSVSRNGLNFWVKRGLQTILFVLASNRISFCFRIKVSVENEYVAISRKHRISSGRGTDNNQLMPVIKHQWQIAHAKRPCQLSKWYLRRVCIIQRAAISAASWKMHVDLSRVDRMDIYA